MAWRIGQIFLAWNSKIYLKNYHLIPSIFRWIFIDFEHILNLFPLTKIFMHFCFYVCNIIAGWNKDLSLDLGR